MLALGTMHGNVSNIIITNRQLDYVMERKDRSKYILHIT